MNGLLTQFKEYKCIVAGVYYPGSIGFTSSNHNTYPHYSSKVNANVIAFTKDQVENYYKEEIARIVKNFSDRKRENLIEQIKDYLIFQEANPSNAHKSRTKEMNEIFNPEKLSQYVIDVIFFMHDGFNLNHRGKLDSTHVLSPQVVVNTIDRLTELEFEFFGWQDYIETARHSHVLTLFDVNRDQKIRREARELIYQLLLNRKMTVNKALLYPLIPQNLTLFHTQQVTEMTPFQILDSTRPQTLLFQQGLLSIKVDQKLSKDGQIILQIPNYGIENYLTRLSARLSQTNYNFLYGLFEEKDPFRAKIMIASLFYDSQQKAYQFVKKNLPTSVKISETQFTGWYATYLTQILKDSKFDQVLVGHQVPNPNAENEFKEDRNVNQDKRPDFTLVRTSTGQQALVEFFRGRSNEFGKRQQRYDEMSDLYEWVVVIQYDNQFKKIKDIQSFKPSGMNQGNSQQ